VAKLRERWIEAALFCVGAVLAGCTIWGYPFAHEVALGARGKATVTMTQERFVLFRLNGLVYSYGCDGTACEQVANALRKGSVTAIASWHATRPLGFFGEPAVALAIDGHEVLSYRQWRKDYLGSLAWLPLIALTMFAVAGYFCLYRGPIKYGGGAKDDAIALSAGEVVGRVTIMLVVPIGMCIAWLWIRSPLGIGVVTGIGVTALVVLVSRRKRQSPDGG
jgi:hypothetical protein